jgi:hypothetical protein
VRSRVTRLLLQLLCVFLLSAQHVALTHAIWHASHDGVTDALPVSVNKPGESQEGELTALCVFDAVLGQVLGGAAPSEHSLTVDPAIAQAVLHYGGGCTVADLLAPRSRGPPVLL